MTITINDERIISDGIVRFTREDAQSAADAWGFNCGPGALCAVLSMTPDEIRPHMGDFERKGYTNPTLMFDILNRLGADHRQVYRGDNPHIAVCRVCPSFGLVRIQWGGRWTDPGVPMRVRYRHTHWVAWNEQAGEHGQVFDINAICAGGWISFNEWSTGLVPWLIKQCVPGGNGRWWPTHCIELSKQLTLLESQP